RERCAGAMQDRPSGDGGLMPTGLALPEPSPRELECLGMLAARTEVSLGPPTFSQIPTARSYVAELRLKLGQRPRKVRPSHTGTLPVGVFGVNRISMTQGMSDHRSYTAGGHSARNALGRSEARRQWFLDQKGLTGLACCVHDRGVEHWWDRNDHGLHVGVSD